MSAYLQILSRPGTCCYPCDDLAAWHTWAMRCAELSQFSLASCAVLMASREVSWKILEAQSLHGSLQWALGDADSAWWPVPAWYVSMHAFCGYTWTPTCGRSLLLSAKHLLGIRHKLKALLFERVHTYICTCHTIHNSDSLKLTL